MVLIPSSDPRTEILRVADELFYADGVAGVGMDDVRNGAGVSLRRLYGLYPSKRILVEAWLDDRHHRWMAWFTDAADRLAADGVEPLLAAFDAVAEWVATPGFRGCAFLNTAAEIDEIDETHRRIIAEHKRDVTRTLTGWAAAAGLARPTEVGAVLAVLLDGAIVQAAVFSSVAPVAAARSAAALILEAHR